MRIYLRVIRLIGVLVPRRLRRDWRQEWEAELRYRELRLAEWERLDWRNRLDLLRRSLGAFVDALILQPQRLEDEVFQDLRFGMRVLAKNPGYALVALVTLALGIGANTAVFSVVNAVLLRPLPYAGSERLMQVGRAAPGSPESAAVFDLSEPKFVYLRDHAQSFEAVTTATGVGGTYNLSDENQAEYVNGLRVSAEFFRVLAAPPAAGREFTAAEDSPGGERVVILSDGLWRRRFGADAAVLDRAISLNGVPHRVVGVMPAGFDYQGPQDVFVPLRVNPASQNEGHNWTVIGRLKPDVTPQQARAELQALFDRFSAAYPRLVQQNETFGLRSWQSMMTRDVHELLWVLLGAVSCILLIACANVANLQLTRGAARRKEMAVRLALGAGRFRLVRQLLTEGIVLAMLGCSGGILLSFWGVRALLRLVPDGLLPRAGEVDIDGRVLAYAVSASLLTGLFFSLIPAWQTLGVDLNRSLKEGGAGAAGGRGWLRGGLVVVEVALALTLSVGAGLLLRTFANLRGVEPGFEPNNVLTFNVGLQGKDYSTLAQSVDFYRRALERIGNLPGVEAAALTNKLPLDAWFNLPYRLAGQSELAGSVEYRLISPDYFRAMRMSMREGREFTDADLAGVEPVVIVNEAFARKNFPDRSPLGEQLCAGCQYGDPASRRVVGVVNETKQRSLKDAAPPTVYVPLTQASDGVRQVAQQASFVVRTTGDPAALKAAVEGEMNRLAPTLPVRNLRPLADLVGRSVAPQRFNLTLLGLFAGLGLLLAAVGIYGVLAYRVAQRTHEIGIRMALGAQRLDVLKLVVGQGMKLAFAGVALGLLASYGLTRWLQSLLFSVSATDPATYILVGLLMAAVAFAACLVPAGRAAKTDPLVAMRDE